MLNELLSIAEIAFGMELCISLRECFVVALG